MTEPSSGEPIEAVLAQLRAEESVEQDASQRALLRHEAGVLEESRGRSDEAMADYLAAHDADREFRQPLLAIIRLLWGKQAAGEAADDLGELLERAIDLADTAGGTASALWELAIHRAHVGEDRAAALAYLEQAVEQNPDDVAAWLELELLAAREGATDLRLRALEARASLTNDPSWQGLLLTELALLCAGAGDTARAASLLDTVAGLEGRARFRSRLALESVARAAGDDELLAHAVEGQAELITLALDDPDDAGSWGVGRAGVPRRMTTPAHAAEAWLRAGELRRRAGDAAAATAALNAASERLEGAGAEAAALVARLRMAAADAAGDRPAALAIAHELIERGAVGPVGASLWLRVGRAAEEEGDLDAALKAYGKALELDPESVPALTAFTDLLAQGDDPRMLAEALERGASAHLPGGAEDAAAKARDLVTVAYVWSVRAGDVERGKAALARAVEGGLSPLRAHRLARTFAALAGEDAWYDEATAALVEIVEAPLDRGGLLFELGRVRMLQGDRAGAIAAFERLAAEGDDGSGAWLGRALAAYAVGVGKGGGFAGASARDERVLTRLAEVEPDPSFARGLMVVAATHAANHGRRDEALAVLAAEHEREPSDLVVAIFLAELRRRSDDPKGAAAALSTVAHHVGEPAVGGALQLEAGLVLWQAGLRREAIAAFEEALDLAPRAAQTLIAWGLRAASPDDPEARLRAIDLGDDSDDDRLGGALERLGLALGARDEGEIASALDLLEELAPGGDVALATALARVLVGTGDPTHSLEQLEDLGGEARALARAERFRVARFVDRDALATLDAARQWCEASPSLPAALEWLAAAQAADDRDAEVLARQVIVSQLDGEAQASAAASLALVRSLHTPGTTLPLLKWQAHSARLTNLDLSPPGSEPVRRATALRGLGAALGTDSARLAARLAAWSDLAAGSVGEAQKAFRALCEVDPQDKAAWEGLRAASEKLGDHTTQGVALARLGSLADDDAKGAELWEQAGLLLLDHTTAHDDAEIAFRRALDRDRTRAVAFDKLFRRVRKRKDNDQLLKLIAMRLEVTNDEQEIIKMYWERARVYRDQGDYERALKALKDVTILEPDHVGALALAGEVAIKNKGFDEAAPLLARLATLDGAPRKQRLLSAIAAVDLYEKKLDQPAKALEVLLQLYRDGLSTGKVRERLARAAARQGRWNEAVELLERLMKERDTSKGRAEAARLAMAIYRDKLEEPQRAAKAVAQLLTEIPDDREALELVLRAKVSQELLSQAVPRGKKLILDHLAASPFDQAKVDLIAEIAAHEGNLGLRRAALGCSQAIAGSTTADQQRAILEIDARSVSEPQIVLDDNAIIAIADPEDVGPIPELFAISATVIAEAMGPSTKSEDVGRRQRVDTGHPMRHEASRWMGALGFDDFDLYVGGREPSGVKGIADDKPALVVGPDVRAPLDAAGRSAMAREVFALRRGTTAVIHCDDATIASIVVAVCKEAGVNVADPPYAIYKEIERVIHKAMSRRVRKAVVDTCQRVVASGQDAGSWAAAARRSIDRMAVIASGDAASVIDQVVGPPGSPERLALAANVRAKRLLSFVMSSEYLELRRKLGMGVR